MKFRFHFFDNIIDSVGSCLSGLRRQGHRGSDAIAGFLPLIEACDPHADESEPGITIKPFWRFPEMAGKNIFRKKIKLSIERQGKKQTVAL